MKNLNALSACDKLELKQAIKQIDEIRKLLIEMKPRKDQYDTYKQYQKAYIQWNAGCEALHDAAADVSNS